MKKCELRENKIDFALWIITIEAIKDCARCARDCAMVPITSTGNSANSKRFSPTLTFSVNIGLGKEEQQVPEYEGERQTQTD